MFFTVRARVCTKVILLSLVFKQTTYDYWFIIKATNFITPPVYLGHRVYWENAVNKWLFLQIFALPGRQEVNANCNL